MKNQSNSKETKVSFPHVPFLKGTKIIDHIITNIPNKILYSNVLPCPSISDHDAPYIET